MTDTIFELDIYIYITAMVKDIYTLNKDNDLLLIKNKFILYVKYVCTPKYKVIYTLSRIILKHLNNKNRYPNYKIRLHLWIYIKIYFLNKQNMLPWLVIKHYIFINIVFTLTKSK